ncbi:hypothetical protein BB559_006245 [Furculomyces boomerangus]|uniref:Bacterial surface antigen (D15) domain-containing protein n=1 Tax=Furculomyces boomerangus TaxID=61424 RepID=A0A2T9Y413_9FUNG|nr:hypothetical protein BB559_006245 [Furculomyces boomerangus]
MNVPLGFSLTDTEKKKQKKLKKTKKQKQSKKPVLNTPALDYSDEKEIKVEQISINGLTKARKYLIKNIVQEPLNAKSLPQLFFQARHAAGILKRLDMAQDVQVSIEKSKTKTNPNEPVPMIVTLECTEKKRIMVQTGAEVSSGEVSGNLMAKVRNVFGGGESLEFKNRVNKSSGVSLQTVFSAPINANPLNRLDLLANQGWANYQLYSGYKEVLREFSARYIKLGTTSHEFGYNASWREISDLIPTVSNRIRSEAGHSLKSSLNYTFLYDNLDELKTQKTGSKIKLSAEVAGIGGDVFFAKSTAESKCEYNIHKKWSLVSVSRLGALFPILESQNTSVIDRFFLGGPMSIRGFPFRGLGPFQNNDNLGGDFFGFTSISLLTPLPFIKTDRLMGQIWADGAAIAMWDKEISYLEQAKAAFSRPTISTGFGLAYQ